MSEYVIIPNGFKLVRAKNLIIEIGKKAIVVHGERDGEYTTQPIATIAIRNDKKFDGVFIRK